VYPSPLCAPSPENCLNFLSRKCYLVYYDVFLKFIFLSSRAIFLRARRLASCYDKDDLRAQMKFMLEQDGQKHIGL